jgi:hypothetical protein
MLQPLGSGSHTLHFGGMTNVFTGPDGQFTFPSFDVNVTDNVRATGGGGTAIPLPAGVWSGSSVLALLGLCGVARRRLSPR